MPTSGRDPPPASALRSRHCWVSLISAVDRFDQLDRSEVSALRTTNDLQVMRLVATAIGDHQLDGCRGARLDHRSSILRTRRHRHFAQHVLPDRSRTEDVFLVHRIRQNDVDGLDVFHVAQSLELLIAEQSFRRMPYWRPSTVSLSGDPETSGARRLFFACAKAGSICSTERRSKATTAKPTRSLAGNGPFAFSSLASLDLTMAESLFRLPSSSRYLQGLPEPIRPAMRSQPIALLPKVQARHGG